MRLSYKVFMTAALIIIALLGVAAWSLLAINRLVEVNRGLATQALPALRTATGIDRMLGATYAALDEAQVEARQLEERTWNTVYWWMLAAVAVALAATGFLTLHMTRALRGLTVATAQLAEGAFTKPLPVSSRDEIGQLSRSFNRMAERLHEVEQLKEEFFSH